ncbi:MAG: DUF4832 domain-containing protein [Candidatus Omnitrophica bacterium]|nr:DUF4832 domain-containing protein [Candidatus Omnitrophota bacterium]
MAFVYEPLRQLMTGPSTFVWDDLESQISAGAQDGCQMVVRIYLDYPKRPTGIPQFLLDGGLLTRPYTDFNNTTSVAPDYEDPALRKALADFIAAFGQRYDGDPRVGFIQIGLLGYWGEWHMSGSISRYFASATVRAEVMDAFQKAFVKTKILTRSPSNENKDRPFGYHDDSFAYQTLSPPTWTMLGVMKTAGSAAMNKWKTYPFGGEIRPEIQVAGKNCMWDEPSCVPVGQEYDRSVDESHASWMLNAGAFVIKLTGDARARALAGAGRLGYEYQVVSASVVPQGAALSAAVQIQNMGVAPFYYDWMVELAAVSKSGQILHSWPTPWRLTTVMPGEVPKQWTQALTDAPLQDFTLLMRVVNPLTGGKVFHFANAAQDQTLAGWLTLLSVVRGLGDVSGDGQVTVDNKTGIIKPGHTLFRYYQIE